MRLQPMTKNTGSTTALVTPQASKDGKMPVSHSNDNDLRIHGDICTVIRQVKELIQTEPEFNICKTGKMNGTDLYVAKDQIVPYIEELPYINLAAQT